MKSAKRPAERPESAESITVKEPPRETIRLAGVSEVAVTRHVLDRLSDRRRWDSCPGNAAQSAWKKLKQLATDPSMREVARDGLWTSVARGPREGRYFLNARYDLVLVVTDNPGEGTRLVTAYRAGGQFHAKTNLPPRAAHKQG